MKLNMETLDKVMILEASGYYYQSDDKIDSDSGIGTPEFIGETLV